MSTLYDIVHLGGENPPPIITIPDLEQVQEDELLGPRDPTGEEEEEVVMMEEGQGEANFDPVQELTTGMKLLPNGPPPPPPQPKEGSNQGHIPAVDTTGLR